MGKEIGPEKKEGIQKAIFLGLRVNISTWKITFSYGAGAMLQECGKGNPGSRIVSVWHLLASYFWDVANLEIHTGNSHLEFTLGFSDPAVIRTKGLSHQCVPEEYCLQFFFNSKKPLSTMPPLPCTYIVCSSPTWGGSYGFRKKLGGYNQRFSFGPLLQ